MKMVKLTLLEASTILSVLDELGSDYEPLEEDREQAIEILESALLHAKEEEIPDD